MDEAPLLFVGPDAILGSEDGVVRVFAEYIIPGQIAAEDSFVEFNTSRASGSSAAAAPA